MNRLLALISAGFIITGLVGTPAAADDRAVCFNQGGAPDPAIEACGRLIASGKFKGPELAKVYLWRAEAWSSKRDDTNALADLNESIRLHPKIAVAYYNRGRSFSGRGEWVRAIADFDAAIRLDPKLAAAYVDRGNAFRQQRQPDRAIADYSEAIRLNPRHDVAYANRGVAYWEKRDYDRAINDSSQAIRLQPQKSAYYSARGFSYEGKGELDSAVADFRKALNLDPQDTRLLDNIKRVERQLASRSSANTSASSSPSPPVYASEDDKACAGALQFEAWLPACDRLIASGKLSGSNLAVVYRHRGNWYQLKNDHDRAVADYTEAFRHDPSNALTANSLKMSLRAVCFLSNDAAGKVAACTRFIAVIPETDNDLPAAYLNRADGYKRAGDRARASADINAALRINPNSSAALRALGALDAPAPPTGQPVAQVPPAATSSPAPSLQPASPPPATVAPDTAAVAPGSPQAQPQPQAKPQSGPTVAALTPPAAAPRPAEVRVALIVGNGNYLHASRLPNPANDAADIAQVLRKLGFEVIEGRDLDKRGLEDKVREFGRKLDRANIALFFYAGHGMQVGGRNYLIPIDAKLERPGDLSFETVDVSQVLAQMEAEQRVNLVFLDACRDNPLARSFARTLGTRAVSVGQGLATIQGALGTMISYATQPDAVALDGDGRNSPFTSALLTHLMTPGIEIGSVMKRVRADVVQATRGKQIPWDHSSLIGDVVLAQ